MTYKCNKSDYIRDYGLIQANLMNSFGIKVAKYKYLLYNYVNTFIFTEEDKVKPLFKHLKKYAAESVIAPLFKLFEALLELIIPILVAQIIDRGIAQGDRAYIVKMVLLMLLMGAVGLAFSLTAQYFSAKAACGTATGLRSAMFAKIQSLSYGQLDRIGVHTLITRMSGDINQVQSGINLTLRLLLRSPFVAFGAMIMAFIVGKNAGSATITFALVIPTLLIVIFFILLGGIPMHKKAQGSLDRVTGALRSNLDGARVIRAFRLENNQNEKFGACVSEHTRLQIVSGRISGLLNPLTYAIINIAIIFLIRNGSNEVYSGALTRGELVALYNYMTQILVELIKMANLIITITKAIACAGRISSLMSEEPDMKKLDCYERAYDENAPVIAFRNVSFTYPGASGHAVSNIDFTLNSGERLGIIGGTGSGKSTIVSLIPRFYDVSEGSVEVFGADVRGYDMAELRKNIGYAAQKATVFRGTIRENILWGKPDANETDIKRALDIAQFSSVVAEKRDGLDHLVEQGGRNLSGGQKQRLNVARALVGKPQILILDDSSSALDRATDAAMRSAIDALDYSPAVVIVSQRVESVAKCDKILVLDAGHTAGIGTHSQLYESCSVYREICDSQMGGESL